MMAPSHIAQRHLPRFGRLRHLLTLVVRMFMLVGCTTVKLQGRSAPRLFTREPVLVTQRRHHRPEVCMQSATYHGATLVSCSIALNFLYAPVGANVALPTAKRG